LAEGTHAEAQCISLPSLLLHRDHPSKLTVGAGEALFETADSLDLPETMADDDCCWRRSNFDPLCRSEFDPGLMAGR
jgi:hypothetical protein